MTAFLLGTIQPPDFPAPVGVFRAIDRPSYDAATVGQVEAAKEKLGKVDLDALFNQGDTWEV